MTLRPLPGRVLVELLDKYQHVATTEQKYDTKTSGVCIDWFAPTGQKDTSTVLVYDTIYENLPGKVVYWEEYKDGAVIEQDGRKYAFIKFEDLDGYEDVEA